MSLTVGVDVGGTKVAAGVVDAAGRIIDREFRRTPAANPDQTAAVISALVADFRRSHQIGAVGIGAAGFIDREHGRVLFAPNLAWRDEPLQKRVQDQVGLPVTVDNDANAAAWGEAMLGAARGHADVMVITVGTGIGAGIVIGGQLYRGRWGAAGEPGHLPVVHGGRPCGCGNHGCWERYASGSALVTEAREFAARSPAAAAALVRLGGGTPDGITGQAVLTAARSGDSGAAGCFEIIGRWLGVGLAGLAAVLDPSCFVIGGGVSEAGDLLLGPARATFADRLPGRGYRPEAEIKAAQLGQDAGLIGAALLARPL